MSSENEQTANERLQLGQQFSLALIMFHQSFADKLGLNLTDYKVLGLIGEGITAGQIADATGLSTGMVTTVVDRLEKKDYAYRDKDAQDRRKVIIRLNADKVASDIVPLIRSFGQEMGRLFSAYSEQELTLIEGFMRDSIEVFQRETRKLRSQEGEGG